MESVKVFLKLKRGDVPSAKAYITAEGYREIISSHTPKVLVMIDNLQLIFT